MKATLFAAGLLFVTAVAVGAPAQAGQAPCDAASPDIRISPLYKGQVPVHGMDFSPDRRTIGRQRAKPARLCRRHNAGTADSNVLVLSLTGRGTKGL